MYKYLLNVIELRGTWYLPLPKLNPSQLAIFADRLRKKGFAIKKSRLLVARKGGDVLRINPRGLCWSQVDPSDAIAPAMPGVLEAEHEKAKLEEIRALYFTVERGENSVVVRFSTRMESSSLWKALRSSGECGLTPDERDVVLMLVKSATGGCTFVTDFPATDSKVRVIDGRQYYESWLDGAEATSTLRARGEKRERNSYLPRGGILRFKSVRLPPRQEQAAFFSGLGEWCYLRPSFRESSNC